MEDAHSQASSERVEREDPQPESSRRARHRAEEGYEEVTTGRKRILVTGSRDWWNQPAIAAVLLHVWLSWGRPPLTLVHGGARGVDRMAASVIAERRETAPPGFFRVEEHPAQWDVHRPTAGGKNPAGMIRNAEMVALGADLCIAFILNQSPGATGCMRLAEAAGIPLLVYREDGVLPS